MAIDYGRDVFALPGRIDDASSAGCNELIKRNKAELIESADDLIAAMQWGNQHKEGRQTTLVEMLIDLTPVQKQLIDLLRDADDGMHINQMVMETQLAYNIVSSELIMMELQDMVKSMPGGIWRMKK